MRHWKNIYFNSFSWLSSRRDKVLNPKVTLPQPKRYDVGVDSQLIGSSAV